MFTYIYAGIGSRQTPDVVLQVMSYIGKVLSTHGFTLRSGGADGADSAFAQDVPVELQEIYIPWKNFNKVVNGIVDGNVNDAEKIVKYIHPAWERCSIGARKLHSRNVFQILGPEPINNPILVEFVCCYTKDGVVQGGTATAINLAKQHNKPVFNFGDYEHVISSYDPQHPDSTKIFLITKFAIWLLTTFNIELH